MKKYKVYYKYDEEDQKYVAICPEFFGFILYESNKKLLFKSIVGALRVYTGDNSIDARNIELEEKQIEQEIEMNI